MQRFVADLLTAEGALVEPIEPEGLDVLAPPALQVALGVAEMCRLGFGTTLPSDARRVGLETDWLDRFARLLGERGRWARHILRPELRALTDPERMLGHELVLDNATFRLLGVTPAWTSYLILDFHYSAVSDDKRDGVLRLGVNQATGALPDAVLDAVAPWLEGDGVAPWREGDGVAPARPDAADLPPAWHRQRVLDLVARALPARLDTALAPFVKGLQRRLGREQDRLYDYHNDLYQAASRRAAGQAETDPGRPREELRIAAIAREYQSKLDDLARQYSMRVNVAWTQTLVLEMPVQRFEVQIRRRKAERTILLDWNPLARRLESPVCEFSFSAERPRLACDDAVHLVTPAGLGPCIGCDKPFCRACHQDTCPKCGAASGR